MRESPLDVLLLDGVIDQVVGRLNSGKEADIFLVEHRGRVVAAKVYRDRDQRSFKNNADYKEGRGVRNSRTQRAIDTGSRYGRRVEEEEWGTTEARALHRLHDAGVRVPVPVMSYEGVLLMELVTDAEGLPAPRLIEVAHSPEAARALYTELRSQIVRMLCCEIIHGDLSPYNILAAAGGATIIDFPQIVSAAHNSRAEYFFQRDFQNVHRFLAGADRGLFASSDDGRKIWNAYVRRELTPEFIPPAGSLPGGGDRDRRFHGPQRSGPGGNQRPPGPPGQRPQGPPGQRPQGPPGQRPQGPPNQRPQGQPGPRPQGPPGQRSSQGAPQPTPSTNRNVPDRAKVFTSPDRPPRGAPVRDEAVPPTKGRRRPKRRF